MIETSAWTHFPSKAQIRHRLPPALLNLAAIAAQQRQTSVPIATMSALSSLGELPTDIVALIADGLVGDSQSLASLSQTCRAWHTACLPALLHTVDLSSHNAGRQPEHEAHNLAPYFSLIKAEYHNKYRPRNNLVSRQRAFLRLLTEKPELARYVKAFTWTLIWTDFDEDEEQITDIDRETWNVFSRLTDVRRLDLASLHEHYEEPYIRQNPSRLFPAVTELRLLGWMHRGLVRAIVDAIDARKLRILQLHCLQDEGALANGKPLSFDATQDISASIKNGGEHIPLSEEAIQRQETGKTVIFPGPMWLPCRMLRGRPLESLADIELHLAPFDVHIDLRNYHRAFEEMCELVTR